MKYIYIKVFFVYCSLCLINVSTTLFAQSNSQEQMALQFFQEQSYEKAEMIFSELYDKNPNDFYYSYYLQCLIAMQQYKSAEKLVRKQIKLKPNIFQYQVDYGYLFEIQGEKSKSKKHYDAIIASITSNSTLINDLAKSFMSKSLISSAIATYLHGRTLSQLPQMYAMELASLYESSNQYEKAAQEYLQLLQYPNNLSDVESALLLWWLNDEDGQKRNILRTQLLKVLNKYPDNKDYNELMIWYSTQEKDFSMAMKQSKALDKRYTLLGTPVFNVANLALQNKDYITAIDGFQYLINLGKATPYTQEATIALFEVRLLQLYQQQTIDNTNAKLLDNDLKKYFENNSFSDNNFSLYQKWIRFKATYLNEEQEAIKMLEDLLKISTLNTQKRAIAKIDLAQLQVLNNDVWEAVLLNSQVEKDLPNDTLGHLAKFNNAKISMMIGEFEWATAQLDVLRAATTKLIANDAMYLSLLIRDNYDAEDSLNIPLAQYAWATFFVENNRFEKAQLLLDSIEGSYSFSLKDDVLFLRAQIAKNQGNYHLCDSLLSVLILNFPSELLTDDALYERAQLQDYYLKNNLLAIEIYEQLLLYHSDSIYTVEARKRIRTLRGDMLKPF